MNTSELRQHSNNIGAAMSVMKCMEGTHDTLLAYNMVKQYIKEFTEEFENSDHIIHPSMTPKAGGITVEQFYAKGWTKTQLIKEGFGF